MPIRKIPLVTNQYYHLFNRGLNKRPIFRNKIDYKRAIKAVKFYTYSEQVKLATFLQLAKEKRDNLFDKKNKEDKLISVICFCLMPNHFHFLVKQLKDNGVSKFMANFQNSYSKYFNTKYKRSGPILQGPFKAVRVEDDNQLLHLTRYIHLNPYSSYVVKNTKDLENYRWSSLPYYLGQSSSALIEKENILEYFQNVDDFKKFVFDRADYQRKLEEIKHLTLEEN